MRKLLYILSLIPLFLSLHQRASASHCAGGEIVYQHVPGTPDSTYHVTFKLYRDCSGTANAPNNVPLCVISSCTNTQVNTTLLPLTTLPGGGANGSPVVLGCSSYPTTCQSASSTLPGYQEFWYEGDVTLPERCIEWEFSVSISARNTNANLSGGSNNLFFVKATLNNVVAQGNSSPSFTVKPVPFVCINNPYTFNNGAVDANGDSLGYEILQPLAGNCGTAGAPIPFSSTIYNTTTNPIACNNTFVLNPANGQLSFTPSATGKYTLTIRVKEYRSGTLIGTSIRDIQVIVLSSCSSPQPNVSLDTAAIVGGVLSNGSIQLCANTPLAFCFHMTSPLSSAVLIGSDNHQSVAPGSTVTYSGQYSSSVLACFSWTPGSLDTGYKNLSFTVKDSTCLPPGLLLVQTFSVPIYISPVTSIEKDTTICLGDTVTLHALGGYNFTWTVLPGGSPLSSLSCTVCSNPVAHPTVTTSYVVTSSLFSICNKNKDTVTVQVLPAPAIPQIFSNSPVCQGDSLKLYSNTTAAYYSWTGPAGFNSSLPNPVIANTALPNAGAYHLVTSNGSCSSAPATVNVTIVPALPAPVITGNSPVCEGQDIHISAFGQGNSYQWTGPNGYFGSSPDVSISSSIPQNAGIYTVKNFNNGTAACAKPYTYTVVVNPKVGANFHLSRNPICQNDTVTITDSSQSTVPLTLTWSFDDGTVLSGTNAGPYVVSFGKEGRKDIILTATNGGCTDSVKKVLTVQANPLSDFDLPHDLCLGEIVGVQAGHDVGFGLQYNFTFDGATIISGSGRGVYDLYFTDPGYKYLTLTTMSNLCKSVVTTDTVFVHPVPDAHILSLSRNDICSGDSVRVYAQEAEGYTYHWMPEGYFAGSTLPVTDAHVAKTGYLYLLVADSSGCKGKDSAFVTTAPCCEVYLPNAFTPNGDGRNDIFRVVTQGHHSIAEFRITNRWGQTVFETADERSGWDGTSGGHPVDPGDYFYYVKYQCANGLYYEQKGDVMLIR